MPIIHTHDLVPLSQHHNDDLVGSQTDWALVRSIFVVLDRVRFRLRVPMLSWLFYARLKFQQSAWPLRQSMARPRKHAADSVSSHIHIYRIRADDYLGRHSRIGRATGNVHVHGKSTVFLNLKFEANMFNPGLGFHQRYWYRFLFFLVYL